jgi:succinate dehydrogenase / fumarate reductase cytochrome b subunit
MAAPSQQPRPLSPHLSIYKPQMTSGLSIFHKMTGIGLSGGLILLVVWLACLAAGKETYDGIMAILTHPIAKIFLIAWTWAFFFHFGVGIRHLLWATGRCLSLKSIYTTGAIALAFSFLATIGLWAFILGVG